MIYLTMQPNTYSYGTGITPGAVSVETTELLTYFQSSPMYRVRCFLVFVVNVPLENISFPWRRRRSLYTLGTVE